jgi:hypothetical protein
MGIKNLGFDSDSKNATIHSGKMHLKTVLAQKHLS